MKVIQHCQLKCRNFITSMLSSREKESFKDTNWTENNHLAYHVRGAEKEMIIVGGMRLCPDDLETVYQVSPGSTMVQYPSRLPQWGADIRCLSEHFLDLPAEFVCSKQTTWDGNFLQGQILEPGTGRPRELVRQVIRERAQLLRILDPASTLDHRGPYPQKKSVEILSGAILM